MTPTAIALHIRTGEPSAAESIDAWLRAHALEPLGCADAYDACVHLLRRTEQVPELIFIGVDWLAPDEQDIIRYARDTWPAVGIVIYGAPVPPGVARLPLLRICGARPELAALLAEPPTALLERFARAAAPAGAAPEAAPNAAAPRETPPRAALSALLEEDDR